MPFSYISLRRSSLVCSNLMKTRLPAGLLCPIGKSVFFQTSCVFSKVVPYILSDIGEGIVDVVVKEWYVKPGDKVSQFDPVCEVQSDKASVTITSRFDGQVNAIHYEVDAVAKVGHPLMDIIVPDDATQSSGMAQAAGMIPTPVLPIETKPFGLEDQFIRYKNLATPAVRRIARENKVNLSDVVATGKAGRVLKEDIISFLEKKSNLFSKKLEEPSLLTKPTQDWSEELVGVKKVMIKTMTEAWQVPHFSYSDELDVTELLAVRREQKLDAETGVKLTYLPFLLKATSLALLKFPRLNAEISNTNATLTVHVDHNLGVAMDTPAGLLVPAIKQVQVRSVLEIARELNRLQNLAQKGRLSREDLTGGTLTLSNIGAIGGVHATPVLLPPQIVIGALGKIQRMPRYDKTGNLVPRDVMMASWAADHRAVDGATIARFCNLFKLYLASPRLLMQL